MAFLALLAERKINNLRVINIPWSSIPSLATITDLKILVYKRSFASLRISADECKRLFTTRGTKAHNFRRKTATQDLLLPRASNGRGSCEPFCRSSYRRRSWVTRAGEITRNGGGVLYLAGDCHTTIARRPLNARWCHVVVESRSQHNGLESSKCGVRRSGGTRRLDDQSRRLAGASPTADEQSTYKNCRRQHEEMFHALQSTIFPIHIRGNRHVFDVGRFYVQEPE